MSDAGLDVTDEEQGPEAAGDGGDDDADDSFGEEPLLQCLACKITSAEDDPVALRKNPPTEEVRRVGQND